MRIANDGSLLDAIDRGDDATLLSVAARLAERDAVAVWSLLPPEAASGLAGHEVLALFPLMYVSAMSFSVFGMQNSFPPEKEEGTSTPKQVPLRNAKMVKHRLTPVDFA